MQSLQIHVRKSVQLTTRHSAKKFFLSTFVGEGGSGRLFFMGLRLILVKEKSW